jgi:hypothetical protein
MHSGISLLTFGRSVLPKCSGLSLLLASGGCLPGLLFNPEDGGSTLLQNVSELLQGNPASNARREDSP